MNLTSAFAALCCSGLLTLTIACSASEEEDAKSTNSPTVAHPVTAPEPQQYSDLKMFELKGNVQQCVTTTYYEVELREDNTLRVDTARTRTVQADFDGAGNYLTAPDELVKRDAKGRLTYWRDRRPNAKGVHPGVLRDTLHYTHVNDNVLETDGMGEFAVTVYDNADRIVGQVSDPRISDTQTSAFNIYRLEDANGNWTERLTVWITKSPGRKPHVSYTLDRRVISYFPDESVR